MKNPVRRYLHTFTILLLFMLTLFLFSAASYIWSFSEEAISVFTFISTVFFTTLSGIIYGMKSDEKGWLWGIKGGMVFTVLIISVSLVCSSGKINPHMTFPRIILYVFASFIGGIMGINLK